MRQNNKLPPVDFSAGQESTFNRSVLRRGYDFFRNVSYTPYAKIPPIMT